MEDDYTREDFEADRADTEYSLLKDEGRRHERWPWLYGPDDVRLGNRESGAPSERTSRD